MATYWTIAVAGVEKSLANWGVCSDIRFVWANKGGCYVTLRTNEKFDAVPGVGQWSFKQHAVVYKDRASSTGDTNSFSGGTIYFQGYFDDDAARENQGGVQNCSYRIQGLWWLMTRNQFKQWRNQFTGWDTSHFRVQAAAVVAGGVGYSVNDVLTLVGGTHTVAAEVTVAAVNPANGAVTLVFVSNNGGVYTVLPSDLTNVATTGGSDAGCTLTLSTSYVPLTTPIVNSEIYLGEHLDRSTGLVSKQHNGDQVLEILDWMNESYNPTKRGAVGGRDDAQDVLIAGTIDPQCFIPTTRQNTVACSDAVMTCLRLNPDVVIEEDPTTTPPTLHFRTLSRWDYTTIPPTFIGYTNSGGGAGATGGLPEVTLTITSEQEKSILLNTSKMWQVPGVIIKYNRTSVVEGTTVQELFVDKFPVITSDFDPETQSHHFDLEGEEKKTLLAAVRVTSAAALSSGLAADLKDWWIAHDKSLTDPNIDTSTIAASVASLTVKDDNGNSITLANYPNELLSNLPSWVPVSWVRAHVSTEIGYRKYKESSHTILNADTTGAGNGRPHRKTIILTNAVNTTYTVLESFTPGELVPTGVAESAYRSAAASIWSGSISLVNNPLRTDIRVGVRLKLIGPTTTFTNVLVQQVETSPVTGEMDVTFGPCPPVDVNAWVEMARASRIRTTYKMPSNRSTGVVSATADSINASSDPAADSTSHGLSAYSFRAVTFVQS